MEIEKKIVLRIYICLIALILIDPLLKNFISNTTFLRSCELICYIIIMFSEWKLYLHKGLVWPRGGNIVSLCITKCYNDRYYC